MRRGMSESVLAVRSGAAASSATTKYSTASPVASQVAPSRLVTRSATCQAPPWHSLKRRATAWGTGVVGLLAYNWWALVLLRPDLLRSPDEFFSNLEVTGHPYATLMQGADTLAGLLLLTA